MAEEGKIAPIIVINKKVVHGGHHGGAWKVAYADFVTAMMALFIVLWLLNTAQNVRDAIAGYFKDPTGNGRMVGSALAGAGEALQLKKEDLEELKEKLEDAIKEVPEFKALENNIQITVTGEGLRIELMESEKAMFFESGNSNPSVVGQDFLAKIAKEIGKLNNFVTIEGHTDSKPFSGKANYSNWELSADRANAARRLMEISGLRNDQVTQVRGFADQRLRKKDDPDDPSNRRISIIVQYEAKVRDEDKSLLQKMHDKEVQSKEVQNKNGGGGPEHKPDIKPSEAKPEQKSENKIEPPAPEHKSEKKPAKQAEAKPAPKTEAKKPSPTRQSENKSSESKKKVAH